MKRKPYDYVEAFAPWAPMDHPDRTKRVLRKLVREAVRLSMPIYVKDEQDRIAKELVP